MIAELGCNHMGNFDMAHEMIDRLSKISGLRYVKFQKRNVKELLSPDKYNAPHPNPQNAFGKTYGKHRESLEFSFLQHRLLKKYCEAKGLSYSCSVWDKTSASEIASLKPDYIKIPSALNLNLDLLNHVYNQFDRMVHISLGMVSQEEVDKIVSFLRQNSFLSRTVLYSCVSGYPIEESDLSLREIERLKSLYGHEIAGVGFSGHHGSLFPDGAAVALGARWVERHVTLDKNLKGSDHKASLLPEELSTLCFQLNEIDKALSFKKARVLEGERKVRDRLIG